MVVPSPRTWLKGPNEICGEAFHQPTIYFCLDGSRGGSVGAPFVPLPDSLLPGLRIWVDATDATSVTTSATSSGTRVTQIVDQISGVPFVSRNGPSDLPAYVVDVQNYRNGLAFNGFVNQDLACSGTNYWVGKASGPITVAFIATSLGAQHNNASTIREIVVGGFAAYDDTDDIAYGFQHDGGSALDFHGATNNNTTSAGLSSVQIRRGSPENALTVEVGTERRIYVRGSGNVATLVQTLPSTTLPGLNGFSLGGRGSTTPARASHDGFNGILYEVLIWDTELTDAQIETFSDYCEAKYYGAISYPGPTELSSISGLCAWMKLEDGYVTFSGGTDYVTEWRDAAGVFPEITYVNTSPTGNLPLLVAPSGNLASCGSGLYFNGTKVLKLVGSLPGVGDYPWHVFIRCSPDPGTTNPRQIFDVASYGLNTWMGGSTNWTNVDGAFLWTYNIGTQRNVTANTLVQSTSFPPGDPQSLSFSRHSRAVAVAQSHKRNATSDPVKISEEQYTGTFSSHWFTSANAAWTSSIGGRAFGPDTNNFEGYIHEIMVYHGDLTEANKDLIIDYITKPTISPTYIPTGGLEFKIDPSDSNSITQDGLIMDSLDGVTEHFIGGYGQGITYPFTISMWFRHPNTSSSYPCLRIQNTGPGSGTGSFSLHTGNSPAISVGFQASRFVPSEVISTVYTNNSSPDNNWHHVIVYAASSTDRTIVLDGDWDNRGIDTVDVTPVIESGLPFSFMIGASWNYLIDDFHSFWNGAVTNLVMWSGVPDDPQTVAEQLSAGEAVDLIDTSPCVKFNHFQMDQRENPDGTLVDIANPPYSGGYVRYFERAKPILNPTAFVQGVITIADKSGKGRHMKWTVPSELPYTSTMGASGLRCLVFSGAQKLQYGGIGLVPSLGPFEISMVCLSNDITASRTQFWLGDDQTTNNYWNINLTGNVASDPVRFNVNNGTETFAFINNYIANSGMLITAIENNYDSRTVWMNGVQGSTNNTAKFPVSANSMTIGYRGDSTPSNFAAGRIGGILIYSASGVNRVASEEWLSRWL